MALKGFDNFLARLYPGDVEKMPAI